MNEAVLKIKNDIDIAMSMTDGTPNDYEKMIGIPSEEVAISALVSAILANTCSGLSKLGVPDHIIEREMICTVAAKIGISHPEYTEFDNNLENVFDTIYDVAHENRLHTFGEEDDGEEEFEAVVEEDEEEFPNQFETIEEIFGIEDDPEKTASYRNAMKALDTTIVILKENMGCTDFIIRNALISALSFEMVVKLEDMGNDVTDIMIFNEEARAPMLDQIILCLEETAKFQAARVSATLNEISMTDSSLKRIG